MPSARLLMFVPLLAILYSCGYQMGHGEGIAAQYRTISVPYVEGDMDGSLTAALVRTLVQSGTFEYRHTGGRLTLLVKEVELDEENIGFRYYRKKSGKLSDDIVPTEVRMTAVAEIVVVDSMTNGNVLGPVIITASVDYDHDFYSSRDSINIFSLGQLSDMDSAYDEVQTPLQQRLAQKIVDYISQSW